MLLPLTEHYGKRLVFSWNMASQERAIYWTSEKFMLQIEEAVLSHWLAPLLAVGSKGVALLALELHFQ